MKGRTMIIQSSISKFIDTSDQEAQYDTCVKKLLSERIILAWIMKECVSEFSQYSIPSIMKDCIEGDPQVAVIAVDPDELDYADDIFDEEIEGLNSEDNSIKEGRIYYDIRFSAIVPDTKKPIHLIINVEAQKSDRTPYPLIKRAVYYASRMISAQKNKVFVKSHYEKIRKVYSIWIQMNVDSKRENTITEYSISEKNIVGTVNERKMDYDLMTVIMLGLGDFKDVVDKPILRLLDVLLSAEAKPEKKKAILEQDFDIPMSTAMKEEVNIMCNLGEGIRERTSIITQANIVLHMMQAKNYSLEEAMDTIGITDEDRKEVMEIIDAQLEVN